MSDLTLSNQKRRLRSRSRNSLSYRLNSEFASWKHSSYGSVHNMGLGIQEPAETNGGHLQGASPGKIPG